MIIKQLEVQAFRNIAQATLFPHPRLTLLSGSNGSGKSSVLEAIHCLSTGHSYRTRRYKELIKHDSEAYLVSAVLNNKQTEQEHRCGLQRYRDGRVDLKLDFETITAISPITQLLAIKTLTPDCHRLLQEGPDERRAFLDWGVFHVKQDYFMVWKNFKRVLNQRNQLLKLQSPRKEVEVWDEEYVYAANLIDFNRTEYLSKLAKALNNRLQEYDIGFHVELVYKPGWDSSVELKTLLRKNYSYHTRMKTTTDGPHRGDLVVNIDRISAKKVLSRGQEKWLIYLLHLSQLDVLHQDTSRRAILICDDLGAEMDQNLSEQLMSQLFNLDSQVFICGVDVERFQSYESKRFHVKHGVVEKVV